MSDKCPQNFVQVVGQMSVSDKCPCWTNVRLPKVGVLICSSELSREHVNVSHVVVGCRVINHRPRTINW